MINSTVVITPESLPVFRKKDMNGKPTGPFARYNYGKTFPLLFSYLLAPEHPYPTLLEDCLTATILPEDCPGRWWSCHPWRGLRKDWMWRLVTRSTRCHGVGSQAGLDDLGGLFQPRKFCDSVTAWGYGVDPSHIIISGDSGRGAITAAVAQALVNRRDFPKLRAQILIYPFLPGVDFNLPSYQQRKGVPILLKEQTLTLAFRYLNKDLALVEALSKWSHVPEDLQMKYQKWVSPDHIPREFKTGGYKPQPTLPFSEEIYTWLKPLLETVLSPLLAEASVTARLPETLLLTCEVDVLRDDRLLYKKR